MKFKLDENLHPDADDLLRQHGHDALTVGDQGLRGSTDGLVAQICRAEARALVTLDLDFSDMRTYPPAHYAGIIVLRLADQSRTAVLRAIRRILPSLDTETLDGHLWIVDEYHIRVRNSGPGISP